MEKESLYRKSSMERISSPEQLNDYLHVTSPAIWLALAAVLLLLISLLIWSSVTAVESFATGTAEVEKGIITVHFDDQNKASHVKAGMDIWVGRLRTRILSVGEDPDGNLIAVATTPLPDGTYTARAGYDSTKILTLLLN